MQKKLIAIISLLIALTSQALAQKDGLKTLPLNDLSNFRQQSGNWMIVADVTIDPAVDIHHPQPSEQVAEEKPSKRKKGKKKETAPVVESPKAVTYSEGKGVLLNINDEARKDALISLLEHGDIELELDVMLPKGSNSGLYLQGRYELQFFDSWGVRNPTFADMGGIYRNWEKEPGTVYMGKAPLANASKAPGLWQSLKLSFRAPRFDASGKKVENARFVHVTLNGVTIHENVEVPLPTGGPLENNEVAKGPLVIQGDHGPVAIRNVRYKLIRDLDYKIGDVTYEVYHGNFKSTSEFANAKPVLTGKSEELSVDVVDVENAYGIRLKGNVTVPEDARYHFTAVYTGGAKLIIAGREMFNFPTPDGWRRDTTSIFLKAGTHPFEILNFKDASWMPPRLALTVSTDASGPEPLHSINSYPPDDEPTSSIFINPGNEPRLLRAFLDYRGKREDRLTHTIGVGDPSGIHYVYDLRAGNLVCVWRGDFVDATPMWHDRGDGSFRPRGAVLYVQNNQPLAYLTSTNNSFRKGGTDDDFKGKGYSIDEKTGRPLFLYQYKNVSIEDRIYPEVDKNVLKHVVSVKSGEPTDGLTYKLAEGKTITDLNNGRFAIGDKDYYIEVGGSLKPSIRDINGMKELVVPMSSTIEYSIIW